jgi:hypothetical protein
MMLLVKQSKTAFGAAGKVSAPPNPSVGVARKKGAGAAVRERAGGNTRRMQYARNLKGGPNVRRMRIAPVKNAAFGAAQKGSVPIRLHLTRSSPQRWNALRV